MILSESLSKNSSIETFSIASNEIEDKGLKSIFDKLEQNESIISLDVSENNLSESSSTKIKEFLLKNNSVKSINISNNDFGSDGLKEIFEGIAQNTSLTQINLNCLSIDDNCAALLFNDLISKQKSLLNINLSENSLTDLTLSKLNEVIKQNLVSNLILNNNSFDRYNMTDISSAIANSTSLLYLDLSHNSIKEEALKTILEGVKSNKSLVKLDLCHNELSKKSQKQFNEIKKEIKRPSIIL